MKTKTKKSEKNQERVEQLTAKLETGMQELLDSEKYKSYLKAMSCFPKYSSRNIMLIHSQSPVATKVAGFSVWRDEFNRTVKKGESAIWIYAPSKSKSQVETEKIDDDSGKITKQTEEIEIVRFRLVPVFDVSQTEGDPLPVLIEDLQGEVKNYTALLESLKATSPLPIVFETMGEGDGDGYCNYETIGIRDGMSQRQTIATIVHEIAHANLHGKGDTPRAKHIRELEAESVAYVVCGRYGIDTEANSFGYLASWGGDKMEGFKASLNTIQKGANEIIDGIEKYFCEKQKKPSLRETIDKNTAKSREMFAGVQTTAKTLGGEAI